jgi:hypothetical protein
MDDGVGGLLIVGCRRAQLRGVRRGSGRGRARRGRRWRGRWRALACAPHKDEASQCDGEEPPGARAVAAGSPGDAEGAGHDASPGPDRS